MVSLVPKKILVKHQKVSKYYEKILLHVLDRLTLNVFPRVRTQG